MYDVVAVRDIPAGEEITQTSYFPLDHERLVHYGEEYDEKAPREPFSPVLKFDMPPLKLANTVAAHPAIGRLFQTDLNRDFFFLSPDGVTIQDFARVALHFIQTDVRSCHLWR